MSDWLAVAPVLVVLVTAVATLAIRHRRLRTGVSVLGVLAYAAAVATLAWRVVLAPDALGAVAYQVGDWPAPFGITLVADGLSAFMLAMAATVAVAALLFSTRYVVEYDRRTFYHPLFHFLLLGVTGAFLTGDLFNLFVWFEVMLMASYVFVAYYGDARHTRAAFRYVVINIVGSAVFLLAVGGLYATTGTLNMADLASRLAAPDAYGIEVAPAVGLLGLAVSVFALKAGLVPFQFWIPGAYRAAPPPVTALFVAATKKVGVYAIVRLTFTVFGAAALPVAVPLVPDSSPAAFVGAALFLMAVGSILVGGIGAVAQDSLDGVFAYSSIGQVGFIVVPVAIGAAVPAFRRLAVVAALVYALNHALAKGMLFLAVGAVRDATGTRRLADLSGLAGRSPALGGAVLIGLFALIGLPPLSGFFGKFLVFDVAARAGSVPAVGLVLGGALLTIAYASRTWVGGFWGARSPAVDAARVDPLQVAVVGLLALAVVAVGVGFEPVYGFADAAAEAAIDTDAYVETVQPAGGEES